MAEQDGRRMSVELQRAEREAQEAQEAQYEEMTRKRYSQDSVNHPNHYNMAESRITRERARDEGTSRVARVLGLIPEPPNAVTARTIARQLCISRMEVDEALADLVGAGQVERRSYNARRGYTGYCRR